jgi:uncharacterized delta-60 repeat protein
MRLARTPRAVVLAAGIVPLLAAVVAVVALGGSPGRPGPRPAALPSVGDTGPTLDQRNLLRTLAGLPGAGAAGGPSVPENPVPAHFGTLDPTFGTRGTVTTAFPGRQVGASDVALLGDQSIVAVGGALQSNSPDFALARYRRDGALDTTFGTGGLVTTPWPAAPGAGGAQGVAVGAGDRIVVVGTAGLGHGPDIGVAVARYLPSGALDATFGNGGKVVSAVSPVGDGGANAVAVQPDGRIVVVGGANDQANDADFLAVRYLPDGNPDTSFGNNGVALIPLPGGDASASAVAVQPDGAIVIAGTAIGPGTAGQEFGIARLTPAGALDSGFGSGGVVLAQFRSGQDKGGAQSVLVASGGRIVVAGLAETAAGRGAFGLMRLRPDGSPDPTFGTGGMVLTEFDGESIATRVVPLAGGDLVAAGSAGLPSRTALAGYRPDGSLDPAFGTGGRTVTAIGAASAGTSAVVQSSGGIVVAGTSASADFATGGFALARYLGSAGCKPPTCTVGLG